MGFEAVREQPLELEAQDSFAPVNENTSEAAKSQNESKTTSKTKSSPKVAFSVPLTSEIQEEVRAEYQQYVKTGNTSIGSLRSKVLRRYIQIITPTTPDHAALLVSEFSMFIDGKDPELLASLCGWAYLPKRDKNIPKTCTPVTKDRIQIGTDLLKAVRDRAGTTRPTRQPTSTSPTPSLDRDNETSVGDALQWIWDLLKGDFKKDPTTGQTIVNALLGLIPGVDTALDVRDLAANLIDLTYYGNYDQFDPWFNLATTLVGAIPEIGSVIKGAGRLVRRGVSVLPINRIVELAGKLDFARAKGIFTEFLDGASGYASKAIERAIWTMSKQAELLEKAKATAGWFSDSARRFIEAFISRTRAAIERATAKVQAAIDYLVAKFKEVLAAIEDRIAKLTKQADDVETPSVVPKERPTNRRTTQPTPKKTQAPNKPQTRKTETKQTDKTDNTDKTEDTPARELSQTEILRDKFRKKYPSGFATAYRGVRLPKNVELKGTIGGEGTMVILEGGRNAALSYALNPTKNKFVPSEDDVIYIFRMDIKAEDVIAYPQLEDLEHILVDPAIDLMSLPNFVLERLSVDEARRLYNP